MINEPLPSESKQLLDMVQQHVDKLGEHFDTVIIFTTKHVPESKLGGTLACCRGSGNSFARYGQVREWLMREEALSEHRGILNFMARQAQQNLPPTDDE